MKSTKTLRAGMLTCLVAWTFLEAGAQAVEPKPNTDQLFASGLRERQLFSLAEVYCRSRLASGALSSESTANMAVELIRSCTEQALYAAPEAREAAWKKATATASELERAMREHPRLRLIRVQAALAPLAKGELLRCEAEVTPLAPQLLEAAKSEFRDAIRRFERLRDELVLEIPLNARASKKESAEITSDELESILRHVEFQLARAYKQQALCYVAGSDDRANSLSQSLGLLQSLAKGTKDSFALDCRLEEACCHRLAGNTSGARSILAELSAIPHSTDLRLRVTTESARLELAAKRPREALQLLETASAAESSVPAELAYTRLEAILEIAALEQRSNLSEDAQVRRKQAVILADEIAVKYGAYWRRRAAMLLTLAANSVSGQGNLEILERAANEFLVQQRFEESIAAYESASREARNAGNTSQSFMLEYKAALVEQQRSRHVEAAQRLEKLSRSGAEPKTAAEAHLLAAWNLAQAATALSIRAASEEPAGSNAAKQAASLQAEYARLLEEHGNRFPTAATLSRARLWLGKLREHEQRIPAALAAYRMVSRDSPDFFEALAGASRCWPQELERIQAEGKPARQEAIVAVQWFEGAIRGTDPSWPSKWNEVSLEAALVTARLRLRYLAGPHREAEEMLLSALEKGENASEAWRRSARTLLFAISAGLPDRRQEADRQLAELTRAPPADLIALAGELRQSGLAANSDQRASLAKLELRVIEIVLDAKDAAKLSDATLLNLHLAQAEALAAVGKYDEGLAKCALLAAKNADDVSVQFRYAMLLASGNTEPLLRAALSQWRNILARSRPDSESWWRAKFAVAELHFRLGEKVQAAQMIRLSEALNKGLGGEELRPKFLLLLRQCDP